MDLVPCGSCQRHLRPTDASCPFCNAPRTPATAMVPVGPSAIDRVVAPAPKYGGPPQIYVVMPDVNGAAAGKSKLATMLLCTVPAAFGFCGVHRFYTGHIMIGVAQLLTFGGCGIWQLIDLVSILTGKFKDGSGQPLVSQG